MHTGNKNLLFKTLMAAAASEVTSAGGTAAAPAAEDDEASTAKEAIYEMIGDHVKEATGKRIGKTGGRVIFDMVVEQIFAAAAQEGSFRFNGGFGSFHVKEYQAGSRRLPSGATTTFGEREKLRYEEGVVVKALIKNKGDLAVALQARGSRAKPEAEAKPAATTKPTKPAKPAKVAAPAKQAAAPAAATSEEVDLD